eukprot:6172286-Pleurochrysis_carterae.AAC.2
MDPLIFAEAKVKVGPSPGYPREESNSISILGLVKQCLREILVLLLTRHLSKGGVFLPEFSKSSMEGSSIGGSVEDEAWPEELLDAFL